MIKQHSAGLIVVGLVPSQGNELLSFLHSGNKTMVLSSATQHAMSELSGNCVTECHN